LQNTSSKSGEDVPDVLSVHTLCGQPLASD
jgi:hypothetical protein